MEVLIVEDDELAGRALERMVRRTAAARIAATAAEARRSLREFPPVALIVDLGLPDGSGFDFVVYAREAHPAISTLVITGRSERTVANRCFDLGVDYLVKPFDSVQIAKFLKRASMKRASGTYVLDAAIQLSQTEFGLTTRETEILHLAANGISRAELAIALGCEESTVKSHVNNLLRKTRQDSLSYAVAAVLRRTVSSDD